ncbi:hypothetical protein D3C81_2020660 [compost metagenome]
MKQLPDAIAFLHQIVETVMSVAAHVQFDVFGDNNGVRFHDRFVTLEGNNRAAHQMFGADIRCPHTL